MSATPADRFGFFFDDVLDPSNIDPWTRVFGDNQATVERAFVYGKQGPGGGMIIRLANHMFLLVGYGFQATFKGVKKGCTFTGILGTRELEVAEDGHFRQLHNFNGDETRGGISLWSCRMKNPSTGIYPLRLPYLLVLVSLKLKCIRYLKKLNYFHTDIQMLFCRILAASTACGARDTLKGFES